MKSQTKKAIRSTTAGARKVASDPVLAKRAKTFAKTGQAIQAKGAPQPDMALVVRPAARDRWSAATTANMTPDGVLRIMQGVVSGSFVAQWELFDLMEDTWPRLKKNLNELKHNVQKVDMISNAFGSDKKPSALALKKQEVLEAAVSGTLPNVAADENSWEDAVYDCLDAIGKGISVQEIIWEVRAGLANNGGPIVLPRAFQWVYPRHYGYWIDEPNLKLSVSGFGSDWQDFPDDKFIIATFKTKTGHLLKSSLLRSLAMLWIGSNFSYDWALNLAQMFGLPIRWATYDPTQPALLDAICDMLENMGSAGWGAFPAGTTLELKEAVRDAAHNPQSFLLEFADVACDILILGQTLTTTQGARGALALGRVHQDVRAEVIEHAAGWAAKVFNYQFVPALMRLNFGNNDEDPYLTPDIERERDAVADAERDLIIVSQMQLPVGRKWFYARHNIPMPEEGDDLLVVPQLPAPKPGGGGDGGGASSDSLTSKDGAALAIVAKNAAENKLIDNVLENLTHVQARWLAGVRPFFIQLLHYARNNEVTDAKLLETLKHSAHIMPELFAKLHTKDLEKAFFDAISAGLVNGVARGFLQRHVASSKQKEKAS